MCIYFTFVSSYRTAYFEDQHALGTFQFRFNGFTNRPTDHYLRDFFIELDHLRYNETGDDAVHCIDDTPQYEFMMQMTEQVTYCTNNIKSRPQCTKNNTPLPRS